MRYLSHADAAHALLAVEGPPFPGDPHDLALGRSTYDPWRVLRSTILPDSRRLASATLAIAAAPEYRAHAFTDRIG